MSCTFGEPMKTCKHLNLISAREWNHNTPYLAHYCHDCGYHDSGPVATLSTKEQWLGPNGSSLPTRQGADQPAPEKGIESVF